MITHINIKRLRAVMLGGGLAFSLITALIAAAHLLEDSHASGGLRAVTILLLVISPLPFLGAIVMRGMLDRYVADAENFSSRDPLTGLYNQHSFWDLLQYETQRARRQQYKFSLLLIDVDNFKIVNDRYGHEVGDRVLKEFSSIMKAAVRKGDIPARHSGDNFAAILPVCDEEQAYVVARRIMDNVRSRTIPVAEGDQLTATISIGVAVYPNHAQDAQDLFLLADSMLGQAKSSGKDHMTFPSESDNVELIKNLGETNIMILEALRSQHRKKLVPYFQPIVDVQTRRVLAYEVLTRILVDGRVIPAADFIEAAENMGAIGRIDYRLMEQAFSIVKERKYEGTLFLNLSPKALVIADFIPTLRTLFRDFSIDPRTMVFEITERETVKNVSIIQNFVRKLKEEGFRFAIDDFGAGYSSFQYLRTFDIDYLKVDGEFIRNMTGEGGVEKEIVASIASLANRLRIKTIAEYVETESILGEVASAGIHYAQGYFIKRPSPDLG